MINPTAITVVSSAITILIFLFLLLILKTKEPKTQHYFNIIYWPVWAILIIGLFIAAWNPNPEIQVKFGLAGYIVFLMGGWVGGMIHTYLRTGEVR